jgi:hypothetical protein
MRVARAAQRHLARERERNPVEGDDSGPYDDPPPQVLDTQFEGPALDVVPVE